MSISAFGVDHGDDFSKAVGAHNPGGHSKTALTVLKYGKKKLVAKPGPRGNKHNFNDNLLGAALGNKTRLGGRNEITPDDALVTREVGRVARPYNKMRQGKVKKPMEDVNGIDFRAPDKNSYRADPWKNAKK